MGTATALLAAGCTSTGSSSTGAAGTSGGGIATSPASSAPSAPASATSSTALAFVFGCDQQPETQPKTYTLTCGDGGVLLNQLVWSAWGQAQATATGMETKNSCQPSCAAGSPVSTSATATLSGLSNGYYTKLQVVTSQGSTDYTINSTGPVAAG